MKGKRALALVAAALVVGLVAGNDASGFAATAASDSATRSGTGLRLGAAMRDSGGRLLDVVAKLTGLSTTEVAAKRAEGETLAQIAADKGVNSSAVVDEALKARTSTLDAEVKAGTITQAQADAAKATMKARLEQRVDTANTACDGSGMGGGRGRGMSGTGCSGGGCGGAGRAAVTQ